MLRTRLLGMGTSRELPRPVRRLASPDKSEPHSPQLAERRRLQRSSASSDAGWRSCSFASGAAAAPAAVPMQLLCRQSRSLDQLYWTWSWWCRSSDRVRLLVRWQESTSFMVASAGETNRNLAWTQIAQKWVFIILSSLNIITLKHYNIL